MELIDSEADVWGEVEIIGVGEVGMISISLLSSAEEAFKSTWYHSITPL